MKLLNTARKVSVVRWYVSVMIIGILFAAVSGFILMQPKTELLPVKATIQKIESEYDAINEMTEYTVYVTYTAEGQTFDMAILPGYSSSMHEGDEIDIEYEPGTPEHIQLPGSENIPYIILAVGVLCAVAGGVMTVKSLKKPVDAMDEYDKVDTENADPYEVERIKSSTEPTNRYFFRYAGKLNQGYVLEDENKRVIYEANPEKITLVKDTAFTFDNHVSGMSKTVMIGHTVSQSIGFGDSFRYRVPISSSFKVDGRSNWDVLAENGFGFDFFMKGIMPCFTVKHYGVPTATIETSGADLHGEKNSKNPLYKLPVNGYFHVECRNSELDMIFLTCVSITRAIFYEND